MRVHLVHSGALSSLHTTKPTPKPIALNTPMRSGVMTRNPRKNPMHQVCETFKVYGVNANPFKAGTTGGHGEVVSRRNTCVYTHAV
jgi:hypothetical protein